MVNFPEVRASNAGQSKPRKAGPRPNRVRSQCELYVVAQWLGDQDFTIHEHSRPAQNFQRLRHVEAPGPVEYRFETSPVELGHPFSTLR